MKDTQVEAAPGLTSNSPEATSERGRSLASALQGGDVVLLRGSIGAGKSVFARGLALGLGVRRWRGSPTFTLVNEYETKPTLYHIDLYRLQGAEIETLGLEEYAHPGSIVLVEWADRARDYLRSLTWGNAWTVDIEYTGLDTRAITIDVDTVDAGGETARERP